MYLSEGVMELCGEGASKLCGSRRLELPPLSVGASLGCEVQKKLRRLRCYP